MDQKQKRKELWKCMGATQNCINLDPISYFHHGSKALGLGVVAIGTSCYDLFGQFAQLFSRCLVLKVPLLWCTSV